jgi:flagellar basal-body rod protein FlgF
MARERQTEVLANNIANLSTVAFKGEQMVFAEYLTSTAGGSKTAYVQDLGTVRDWSEGPLTRTANPLDVALDGSGFLEVQTANGIRYTRDGRLKLDAQGQLVTLDGIPVLNQGEQPIVLPPGSTSISISEDGSIATRQGTIGRLAVVDFPDDQGLLAEAAGRYDTDQTAEPATSVKVMQGSIEGSNVQPILEITRLMSAARAAGAAKTFQDNEADRHKNAIDRLAKVV